MHGQQTPTHRCMEVALVLACCWPCLCFLQGCFAFSPRSQEGLCVSNPMHSSLAKGLCGTQKAGCLKVNVTPVLGCSLSLSCWGTSVMESVLSEIKPACDVQGIGIKWLTTWRMRQSGWLFLLLFRERGRNAEGAVPSIYLPQGALAKIEFYNIYIYKSNHMEWPVYQLTLCHYSLAVKHVDYLVRLSEMWGF